MAAVISSALRKDSLDFRTDGNVRCKLAVSQDNTALFSGVAGAKVTLAGIAHPTSDFEAATKYYVDTVASGLTVKGSVQYAVLGNLDVQYSEDRTALVGTGEFSALSASLFDLNPANGATIALQTASAGFASAGYAPIAANADEIVATRFLVKGQTDKTRNGVYFLEASTATGWTLRRCANFNDDPSGEIKAGSFVFLTSGYRHVNHGFVLISDSGEKTLRVNGATPNNLQFEQFSGAGQVTAGTNLNKTGDTINLNANVDVTDVHTDTITARQHAEFNSTVHADGAATLGSTLGVTGKITAMAEDHKIASFTVDNGSIVSSTGALSIGSNTFTMGGLATFNGAVNMESNLSVTGTTLLKDPVTMNKTLLAKGGVTMESTLGVQGAASMQSTLAVTGKITALAQDHKIADFTVDNGSVVSASGALSIGSNTFSAGGAASLGSTLDVTGKITALAQDHKIADFTVDNGSVVSASGGLSIGSNTFSAGGAASLGSTLAVTGATSTAKAYLACTSATAPTTDIGEISDAKLVVDGAALVSGYAEIQQSLFVGSNVTAVSNIRANNDVKADMSLFQEGTDAYAWFRGHTKMFNDTEMVGPVTMGDTLGVTGKITAQAEDHKIADFTVNNGSIVSASGALSIGSNTFTAGGAATLQSTLAVTSTITAAAQGHQLADFTVNNGSLVSASGALSIGSNTFTAGGAATLQSTLAVTSSITAAAQNHQLADFTINNGSIVSASPTISHGSNNVTTTGDVSSTNMSFTTLLSGATATFTADCTAQNFFATSDVNLKHEIRRIEGAVEQCQKLRGVEFKWKHGEDTRDQMGVIAQEVEAVYPSLVAEVSGYKRVDYSKLVGLLIEAVKELKQESADLRAEISDLRAQQQQQAMPMCSC